MKKWIFPLVFIISEIILAILFLTPSLETGLPSILIWIKDFFHFFLTSISKTLHLPTFMEMGEENYIFANCISLLILNILIFIVYFVIYLISKRKHKDLKMPNDELTPKSEFDPVFFEKRAPIMRLAFIWVPLNIWILYFFLLNSLELQLTLRENMEGLYYVFEQNILFYNANVSPLIERDDGIKFVVLIVGIIVIAAIYWIIFSFFAALFKTPIAKAKAHRALKEHEKRVSKIQGEEMTLDNIDILEHAKFSHNKSVVETIATIDIKEINEKEKNNRRNYFDDLSQGIVDLGVAEKKLYDVIKPEVERKPLRVIYPSLDKAKDDIRALDQKVSDKDDTKNIEQKSKEILLDSKFDILNTNSEAKLEPFETDKKAEEKVEIVKPLNPKNLRKPVKVIPVNPKEYSLKDKVSQLEETGEESV